MADHFYLPVHRRIYEAIIQTVNQGKIASPVTLKNFFENDADLKTAGGAEYLADLAGNVVNILNAAEYAMVIHDCYLARTLITQCEETSNGAYEFSLDTNIREIIESHESNLFSLAEHGIDENTVKSFRDSIHSAVAIAETAFNSNGLVTGVATGLSDIDSILGGLHPTDLIILAGRPSMGKTALAGNIAFNTALKHLESGGEQGAKVGFFSLEMGHAQITTRLLGNVSNVSSDAIRKGTIGKEDYRRFVDTSHQYTELPLFIDDITYLTISALRSRAKRIKRKHDIGLLIVDYLQLLEGSAGRRSANNRVQEVSEITRGLKGIAKDLNIPVLALSQLSRQVEQREDKRPQLSDLRDSGSIEQDADIVMFVYRDEYYLSREEPSQRATESIEQFRERHLTWQEAINQTENITEVIVSKHRNGAIGSARLHFDPNLARFTDLVHN